MSEWIDVRDALPDPNTKVEVTFSFVASGGSCSQIAWPCTFHPEGSRPPMFVFHSWLGEYCPAWHGQIIAWRFQDATREAEAKP
jgi:hypothetical protein